MDRTHPFESDSAFVEVLAAAVAASGYQDVQRDPRVTTVGGRQLQPDIVAIRSEDGARVVVECKNRAEFGLGDSNSVIGQLTVYAKALGGAKKIIAVPNRVSLLTRVLLEDNDIEV